MQQRETVLHTFAPFVPDSARVLILGTMPSPKSREHGFYYGHPQNRFWVVLATVFGEQVPTTIVQRKAFLTRHRIALWDTLAACEISGADDASIRKPIANDIRPILQKAPIQAIFTTGAKAAGYYEGLILPHTGLPAIALPSPSPANCRYHTIDTLCEAYGVLRTYCPDE